MTDLNLPRIPSGVEIDLLPRATPAPAPQEPQAPAKPLPRIPAGVEIDLLPQTGPDKLWATVQRAAAYDTAFATEAKQLGLNLEMPAPTVALDIDRARSLWNSRREQVLLRQSPAIRGALTDPIDLAEARDALEGLSYLERLARDFEAGRLNAQAGLLAYDLAEAQKTNEPFADAILGSQLRAAERRLQRIDRPIGWDFLRGLTNFGGLASVTMPEIVGGAVVGAGVGLAVGAATGPGEILTVPSGAAWGARGALFNVMRRMEGGHTYRNLVRAGVDQETAYWTSQVAGVAKGGLELVGAGRLAAPFARAIPGQALEQLGKTPMRAAIKAAIGGLAGEAGTEVLQEGVDIAAETANAVDPGDVVKRLLDTAAASVVQTGLIAGTGGASTFIAERRAVEAAKAAQPLLDALGGESPLREQNPAAQAKLVQAIGDATGKTHVYLPGEVLRQLGDALPEDLQRQAAEAVATGGEVAVPIGQYDGLVAEPKAAALLRPHAKLEPTARTPEQIEQFEKNKGDLLEQAAETAEREITDRQAFAASAAKVEEELRKRLGKLLGSRREGNAGAALIRAFVETMAIETGKTPEQFHDELGLTVERHPGRTSFGDGVGEANDPNVLSQGAIATEADRQFDLLFQAKHRKGKADAKKKTPEEIQATLNRSRGGRAGADKRHAQALHEARSGKLDLLAWIAVLGGIKRGATWPGDALPEKLARRGWGIMRVFNERTGTPWERMAEHAQEEGWFPDDSGNSGGTWDSHRFVQAVEDSLSGSPMRHPRAFQMGEHGAGIVEGMEQKLADEAQQQKADARDPEYWRRAAERDRADGLDEAAVYAELRADAIEAGQAMPEDYYTDDMTEDGRRLLDLGALGNQLAAGRGSAILDQVFLEATSDQDAVKRAEQAILDLRAEVAAAESAGEAGEGPAAGADGSGRASEREGAAEDPREGLSTGAPPPPSKPRAPASSPGDDAGRDRGAFDPKNLIAWLFNGADASTIVHESGHYFLTVYARIASQKNAPDSIRRNMQVLLDWFGVKDLETWNAMTLEQQREHHEAFAYNFEKYARDGKAPTEGLKKLFATFRAFLRRIYAAMTGTIDDLYRQETGKPLPSLTLEVRGVMAAMLGGDLEAARIDSMFATAEAAGMNPEAWANYQDRTEGAKEAARQEMGANALGLWGEALGLVRGEKEKAQRSELQRTVARVRADVEKELAQQPVYRAMRFLKTGEIAGEDGKVTREENHKVDRAAVAAMLPEAEAEEGLKTLRPMLKKGGLNPDEVAEAIGYDTGREMVREILAAPPFAEAVDMVTNDRLVAEHGEGFGSEEQLREAVDRAVHSDARVQMLAAELAHLEEMRNAGVEPKAAGALAGEHEIQRRLKIARAAAAQIIADTRLADLLPGRHVAAAARLGREAFAALQAGDVARAALLKQQQILQTALVRAALDAKRDVGRARERFEWFDKKDQDLAKGYETDVVAAGRAILAAFKLGEGPTGAKPHLDAVKEPDPQLYESLLPIVERMEALAAEARARNPNAVLPFTSLTVDEFALVAEGLDALKDQARRNKMAVRDGKKQEVQKLVDDALAGFTLEDVETLRRSLTKNEKRVGKVAAMVAALRRAESLVIQMDGGRPGKLHKLLIASLREAFDDYGLEMNEVVKQHRDEFAALPKYHGKIETGKHLRGFVFADKAQLLGAIAHAGTHSNLANMLLGYEMVPPSAVDDVDTTAWWNFVQELVADGNIIGKADLDAIQSLRDSYEARKARAQAEHKDGYGYRFEEIEALAHTLRFADGSAVTYRGGYLPSKIDWAEARARNRPIPAAILGGGTVEVVRDSRDALASTGRGFSITRTGAVMPRVLDINHLVVALDEHLRFIHLQNKGRDVLRILRNPTMTAFLRQVAPDALEEVFMPWLEGTLQNRVIQPGKVMPQLDWVWTVARRHTVIARMFASLPNAVQQLTGIAQIVTYVDRKFVLAAAVEVARHPIDRVKEIAAASDFMRLRLTDQVSGILDDAPTLLGNAITKTSEWTQKHALFLQRVFQNRVDVIAWIAARDQAIAGGKSEADAVIEANAIVRQSQGSGTAADIAKLERQTPFVRLFTLFSSYWITNLNTIASRPSWGSRATAAANAIVFSGVVAGAITMALRGGWDDDDHDGALWDDVTEWAVREAGSSASATFVPVVGPMVYRRMFGEGAGRLQLGPVVTAIDRAMGAPWVLTRDELRGRGIEDVALLLTLLTGFPFTALARPAQYAVDVERGAIRPAGPIDYGRGLVVGR